MEYFKLMIKIKNFSEERIEKIAKVLEDLQDKKEKESKEKIKVFFDERGEDWTQADGFSVYCYLNSLSTLTIYDLEVSINNCPLHFGLNNYECECLKGCLLSCCPLEEIYTQEYLKSPATVPDGYFGSQEEYETHWKAIDKHIESLLQ